MPFVIHPTKCAHRSKWLEDPNHPFKQGADGRGFVLVTNVDDSKRLELPVTFCIMCGGRLDGVDSIVDDQGAICSCIQSHADDPSCPVERDKELQEFNFLIREGPRKASYRIYFCPWCGTRLPEGRRAERFTRISDEDLKAIQSRLHGAETVSEVIAKIGEPDRVFPGPPEDIYPTKIYGTKKVLRQLDYLKLSSTIHVCVQEYEDASIHILYSGHFIGKPPSLTS